MMEKIKVFWFCNAAFSNTKSNATGTWLYAMANALAGSGEIQLFNITQGPVKNATRQDYQSIRQWIIPYKSFKINVLPSLRTIREIQAIVDDVKPDIIHIWGTERYWGLLTARGYLNGNIVLEIQGLMFVIEKYFYSGLSFLDIIKCFGINEFIKPTGSLFGQKYAFRRWGKFEKEMLMKHDIISTQSDWVRVHVKDVNPAAQLFKTSISLRSEFIEADRWDIDRCEPYHIFTSISSVVSYKGLHILLDATALLKKRYPQIRLLIAGPVLHGIWQGGYTKWLKKKIKLLSIDENVLWLGQLDAKNLVMQMHKANVVVIPSFVESYCVALDEALTVGVPTVATFAGAMPELAMHEKTALFFSPGDVAMCANAIGRFFEDRGFAKEISWNAYNEKRTKICPDIVSSQIAIYREIIDNNGNKQ